MAWKFLRKAQRSIKTESPLTCLCVNLIFYRIWQQSRAGHFAEELMEKVWGFAYYGDLRAVDVAIFARLPEKIKKDEPAQPRYIITKRGLGYYFSKN